VRDEPRIQAETMRVCYRPIPGIVQIIETSGLANGLKPFCRLRICYNNLSFFGALKMAQTFTVKITGMKYVPDPVTVSAGDTVQWTNKDPMDHTATADNGSFDSRHIARDQSFSYTFNGPAATVAYHCTIHPGMKGKVVVTSPPPKV
jgi:plastocyanin